MHQRQTTRLFDRLLRDFGARLIPMTVPPQRIEPLQTDKGSVPVYTTAVVEQPWESYTEVDHEVWRTLFRRQRDILPGRACREFLETQDAMGMGEDHIPKF